MYTFSGVKRVERSFFRKYTMIKLNLFFSQVRFATKKSGGSTSNGRTSNPKYLGFKKSNGTQVKEGDIIIRQRGSQWHVGEGVGMGRDHTLYSLKPGKVVLHYDLERQRRIISVRDDDLLLLSKQQTKQRLRDMVDIDAYLQMDPKQRYNHVFEKIAILTKELQQEREQDQAVLKMQKGTRKFYLSDLTMI